MRLGQLARKLALRPAVIVEFLSQNNISIEEGTNAKLDDSHVLLIVKQFAPNLKVAEVLPAEPEEAEEINLQAEETVEIPMSVEEVNVVAVESPEPQNPLSQLNEVIKAPKVELSGLKVLGKIDLPEKKVKPAETELPVEKDESPKPENRSVREVRRTPLRKNERNETRPRKNPIAQQREREAQEEQEKRRAKAKLEKERRTEYYNRKVKASVPTKAAKLVEEPLEQLNASELKEAPKTFWGRFLRWLTT